MIESNDEDRIPNNKQFEIIVWNYYAKNKRYILKIDQLIVDTSKGATSAKTAENVVRSPECRHDARVD